MSKNNNQDPIQKITFKMIENGEKSVGVCEKQGETNAFHVTFCNDYPEWGGSVDICVRCLFDYFSDIIKTWPRFELNNIGDPK